jgi:hypothetical protein
MMGYFFPTPFGAVDQMGTAYTVPSFSFWSTQRLPSDPLFFAPVTLQNIVVGSRYRLEYNDGSDWQLLAQGEAATTTVELSDIPAYSNPMLIRVRVRKASSAPKYAPLTTFGYLTRDGVNIYIAQQLDGIAL